MKTPDLAMQHIDDTENEPKKKGDEWPRKRSGKIKSIANHTCKRFFLIFFSLTRAFFH